MEYKINMNLWVIQFNVLYSKFFDLCFFFFPTEISGEMNDISNKHWFANMIVWFDKNAFSPS